MLLKPVFAIFPAPRIQKRDCPKSLIRRPGWSRASRRNRPADVSQRTADGSRKIPLIWVVNNSLRGGYHPKISIISGGLRGSVFRRKAIEGDLLSSPPCAVSFRVIEPFWRTISRLWSSWSGWRTLGGKFCTPSARFGSPVKVCVLGIDSLQSE